MSKTKEFNFDDIANSATQEFEISFNDKDDNTRNRIPVETQVVWLLPSEIKTHDTFSKLFRIRENVLESIVRDMKKNGFHENKPVIIWKEKNILIEGHTRVKAAELTNQQIAVTYKSFKSEQDALKFAIKEQYNRRNQTDADNLHMVLHSPFFKDVKNRKNAIAEFLNVSQATAAKYLKIVKAEKKIIEKVLGGIISVNKAYNSLEKKTKHIPNQYIHKKDPPGLVTISAGMSFDDLDPELQAKVAEPDSDFNEAEVFGNVDPELSLITPMDKFIIELEDRLTNGEQDISIKYVLSRIEIL